jgi:phage terminase large subunit-like protein
MCPPGCEVHDKPGDPRTWAMANPGMGYRIAFETIRSEYLGDDPDVFKCERLSIGDWPAEEDAWAVISEEGWANCHDPLSSVQGAPTFSIDVSPNKKSACIAVAGDNGEGFIHTEVTGREGIADYRPGVDWVMQRAKEINKRVRNAQWVIDKGTQAGMYMDEMESAGFRILNPVLRDYAQACGDFFASVMPIGGSTPTIRHLDQKELRTSLAAADRRDVGENMWAWSRRDSATDIAPLVAVTNAVWGHRKRVNKPKPKPKAAWG